VPKSIFLVIPAVAKRKQAFLKHPVSCLQAALVAALPVSHTPVFIRRFRYLHKLKLQNRNDKFFKIRLLGQPPYAACSGEL